MRDELLDPNAVVPEDHFDDDSGDAKRRFCEHCQLHVHNLSAMSKKERTKFVAESKGRTCIAYTHRPDGTLISEGFWFRFFRPLRLAGTAVFQGGPSQYAANIAALRG